MSRPKPVILAYRTDKKRPHPITEVLAAPDAAIHVPGYRGQPVSLRVRSLATGQSPQVRAGRLHGPRPHHRPRPVLQRGPGL